VITFVGRILFVLLYTMTAPREGAPAAPTVQPKPAVPVSADRCAQCTTAPRRNGSWWCSDLCQRDWTAARNHVVPLEATQPTLPDGSQPRRTT
jgi:hypothetical protein